MEHQTKKMNQEEKKKKIMCPLDQESARYWGNKNTYDMFICDKCGLIFVSPESFLANKSVLNGLPSFVYSEDYFSGAKNGFGYVDYDADKEPMVPVFEKYLDLFSKFLPVQFLPAPSLFDVGAATGFFLDLARRRGYKVSGVEMSEYAAEQARRKNLDVKTGDMLECSLVSNSYSIVTMLDVLEHMHDPFAEMLEAHRVLKPGGLLAINTPNGQSVLARLLKTRWHLVVPPEHIFYFSPDNVAHFLETNGFGVVYTSTIGKRFTFAYIFKTLYKWQKLSVWNWAANFFSAPSRKTWSIPINLYDNFFLIAQKK